jgi:rubrerythrin
MLDEGDGSGRCEDCRICSPSPLERLLLLNLLCLVSLRLLCGGEPAETRCPICGHPFRYHKRRAAV